MQSSCLTLNPSAAGLPTVPLVCLQMTNHSSPFLFMLVKSLTKRPKGPDWKRTLRAHQFIYHRLCTKQIQKPICSIGSYVQELATIWLTLIAIQILNFWSSTWVSCSLKRRANKIRVTMRLVRLSIQISNSHFTRFPYSFILRNANQFLNARKQK